MDTEPEKRTCEFKASGLVEELSSFGLRLERVEFGEAAVRAFLAELRRVCAARNAPCPCGSGEKFKRCCGLVHVMRSNDRAQRHRRERV